MAAKFEYTQAEELRDVLNKHGVRYLFLGKSGAILLGYSDTTQDIDIFVEKTYENCQPLVKALLELGYELTDQQQAEILRGKDFIELRSGPFDLDLVFAPDGIESFAKAWERRLEIEGFPVCHIDDIIRSKREANRVRDRESLPRLEAFRKYWIEKQKSSS